MTRLLGYEHYRFTLAPVELIERALPLQAPRFR